MKRAGKGLFISSIVMVLVVAVSLVTSTFAWFSSTSNAEIKAFNVQTNAASGIQIAATKADGTGISSGELALNSGIWSGTAGTYGSYLALSEDDALESLFAVSGDGVNMYMQKDPNDTDADGVPTGEIIEAVANTDYLVLYFALKNAQTSAATITIQDITTKITGDAASTANMAASLRIAFFQINSVGSALAAANANLLYAPYGGLGFNTSTQEYTNGTVFQDNKYITSSDWTNKKTTKGSAPDEYDSANYEYLNLVSLKDSTTWTGKIKVATLVAATDFIAGTGLQVTEITMGDTASAGTVAAAFHTIKANVQPDTAIYCAMVIWFDGESNFSRTALAGGGVDISMNFSAIV